MARILSARLTPARLLPTLAVALLAGRALAQGSDACSTPQAIANVGTFPFTTGTTGTQGQSNALCNLSGTTGIQRDVWFVWTSNVAGTVTLSTCSLTTLDTKVAVYASSGCPGSAAIACNDDACGLQTSLTFTAASGTTYGIQVGVFPGAAGGSGSFTLTSGGGNCPLPGGPDVIVGDLTGPSNYVAASGLDAISLGTTSCNLGGTWLNWFANTNQHPVIGGNLYRYKVVGGAGRFEQIGMSWLKHGFFALSQNLCCPNCSSTDGTHLGVGCSDPYTSSRNGTQGGLGPRWQVNANTGAFTYPPADPSWSGSTARRLQYLLTDVESAAGVRYFGEAQYVTPDDAAAGNQDNNASWRELVVSGSSSDWSFASTGPTTRQQSAVQAWALCESGVTLTNVDLPSEGRFVLGHKVTTLGGGQYRYEYALYNMNSDDSVRSFALPIPAGVTVTNAGFHDLPYRNGDGPSNLNFDGTDWPGSVAGGALTWATTQTFAQNPSANALRWGSTYNFRFDANAAPTSGTITLGRFKSAGTQTTTASVPAAAGPDTDGDGVIDGNDNCPTVPNPTQTNADGDSTGDACDPCTDTDGDGFGNPGYPANTCPPDGCPNDPLKSAPGQCGCGVPDTDSDGDGTPNCNDGCPNDPQKTAPGVCGCGTPDTDSDGDGTPNCNDGCPNDPTKTAPGQCGCGVPDTDSDGDGTPNCNDGCPGDPNKIAPGVCGCGVPDTDSDGDGTANCNDGCPNDPLKIAPGVCGCGVPDTDSDGDGTANCNDGCPNDPLKTAPGICGCGVPDTDSDGDGTANCTDGCPNDPLKTAPGICGCGVPDTDSDGDGTANCNDGCPNDPTKTAPGTCGCGVPDTDSDGDGTANCNDGCPNDPLKTAPGICGCGVPDTDSDGDGTPNCTDGCPNDPLKIVPGVCGCGVAETDSDGDGTPNCTDGCPNDPLKIAPGACGCGTPDTDSDGDGTPNCNDGCPSDPTKTVPGQCGCGVAETDSDADGVADCIDNCDSTPNASQADQDSDGLGDACDNCPAIPNPGQGDCDNDQLGDACEIAAGAPDCNLNGVPDACDLANGTSLDQNQTGVPDECESSSVAFCAGDGSGTVCPCANHSAPGAHEGCLNSLGLGGRLVGSGAPSLSADTLVLSGSQMPNSSTLYFQGTTQQAGGAGAAFGDGKRCAGGAVNRLGTKSNVAGASQYPAAGDPSVSVRGLVTSPGTRTYQAWYRNAATYCTASTFNLTNGVVVIWGA